MYNVVLVSGVQEALVYFGSSWANTRLLEIPPCPLQGVTEALYNLSNVDFSLASPSWVLASQFIFYQTFPDVF